jgi:small-conductance mechanosensitive channel
LVRNISHNKVSDFVTSYTVTGWDVAFAVVALLAFWFASRAAKRGVINLAARLDGVSDDLREMAGRVTGYFVLFVGIGVAASILGAPIQPLLAASIIVGVITVLAVRGVADNFGAGIVLQTRRPIHVGDEIQSLDQVGVVQELNGRSVIIKTYDGRVVHLPNSKVLDAPIFNHSTVGVRRSDIEVRAAGVDAPTAVVEAIRSTTASTDGVLPDPAPVAIVTAIEPDRVTAVVRCWHEPLAGPTVTAAVIDAVWSMLAARGLHATVVSPPPAKPAPPPGTV